MATMKLFALLFAILISFAIATPIQDLRIPTTDSSAVAKEPSLWWLRTVQSDTRAVYLFNDNWLYAPSVKGDEAPSSEFKQVTLPHTNIELPYHDFDDQQYQFISTYRKVFRLPEALNGRRVYVDFDGVMLAAQVSLNGQSLGAEHKGGYIPFSFDLTPYLKENDDNVLTVLVDSTERKDIPPFGGIVDYLTFGGIYRDVRLRIVKPVHIKRFFAMPIAASSERPKLAVNVYMRNQDASLADRSLTIKLELQDYDRRVVGTQSYSMRIPSSLGDFNQTVEFAALPQIRLWDISDPYLYYVHATISTDNGQQDFYTDRFGFRDVEFRKDGAFYLNNKPLFLFGLNRHQNYPYFGAAAPPRLQIRDADILKFNLSLNIVRSSHYPQSPYFLDRCDEIGLLVFEEIPGWQHIGDDEWKKVSLNDLRVMIERDWNHPSVMLWGVRINESPDDTEFYTATNALAHSLDSTRQTGGVRNFLLSELLEDVFTFNDFSNGIREPTHVPHLVTEFNGHMFPTKSYDQEERMIEHVTRHARIHNEARSNPRVSGALAWCYADYNTHQQFGSGDRICYHGVMDIFRIPKYAAFFYASQVSPAIRPVLAPVTLWTMGDRDGGGNNPLMILTNCDYVDVFLYGVKTGRYYPDTRTYPNLEHPPVIVRGLTINWGQALGDLKLVGFHNDQPIVEKLLAPDGVPVRLTLEPDDTEIFADGADMTRVVFRIVGKHDDRLPYSTKSVSFQVTGPGVFVGENPFSVIGGQAAIWIRATHQAGTIKIRAETSFLEPVEVTIQARSLSATAKQDRL